MVFPSADGIGGDAYAVQTRGTPAAYAYGQRGCTVGTIEGEDDSEESARAANDWLACIPNAHPGYITWGPIPGEPQAPSRRTATGTMAARASPPRARAVALLQGARRLRGDAGSIFGRATGEARGKLESWYVLRPAPTDSHAEPKLPVAGQALRSTKRSGSWWPEKMTPWPLSSWPSRRGRRSRLGTREAESASGAARFERAQIDTDPRAAPLHDGSTPRKTASSQTRSSRNWNEKLRRAAEGPGKERECARDARTISAIDGRRPRSPSSR